MRLILAGTLLLLAGGAQAADCSKWKASMEEGEGGSRMVARMCNAAGGELTIECGAPGRFLMAFAPSQNFAPPVGNPDFVGSFSIKIGTERFDRDLIYGEKDGLMEAEVPFKDKLAEALGKADGGTISFASPKAGIAESSFPLNGAAAALKKLRATCRKG